MIIPHHYYVMSRYLCQKYNKICSLTICLLKPDLHKINAHIKFGENPLTYTRYCPQTKKYERTDGWKGGHMDINVKP